MYVDQYDYACMPLPLTNALRPCAAASAYRLIAKGSVAVPMKLSTQKPWNFSGCSGCSFCSVLAICGNVARDLQIFHACFRRPGWVRGVDALDACTQAGAMCHVTDSDLEGMHVGMDILA